MKRRGWTGRLGLGGGGRVAGFAFQVAEVPVVPDVAVGGVVVGGVVPRRPDTGVERGADGVPALLAQPDVPVERGEIPARRDLLAERADDVRAAAGSPARLTCSPGSAARSYS